MQCSIFLDQICYFRRKTVTPSVEWRDSEANHAVETVIQLKNELMTSLPLSLTKAEQNLRVYAEEPFVEILKVSFSNVWLKRGRKELLLRYSQFFLLQMFEDSELTSILQIAKVSIFEESNVEKFRIETEKSVCKPCERCRRYICSDAEELCCRCKSVVENLTKSWIPGRFTFLGNFHFDLWTHEN